MEKKNKIGSLEEKLSLEKRSAFDFAVGLGSAYLSRKFNFGYVDEAIFFGGCVLMGWRLYNTVSYCRYQVGKLIDKIKS